MPDAFLLRARRYGSKYALLIVSLGLLIAGAFTGLLQTTLDSPEGFLLNVVFLPMMLIKLGAAVAERIFIEGEEPVLQGVILGVASLFVYAMAGAWLKMGSFCLTLEYGLGWWVEGFRIMVLGLIPVAAAGAIFGAHLGTHRWK